MKTFVTLAILASSAVAMHAQLTDTATVRKVVSDLGTLLEDNPQGTTAAFYAGLIRGIAVSDAKVCTGTATIPVIAVELRDVLRQAQDNEPLTRHEQNALMVAATEKLYPCEGK